MPYVSKIIRFMKAKAALLPPELSGAYFTEEDIELINNDTDWTPKEARAVCRVIFMTLEGKELTDRNTCPYCIRFDDACNKCTYFKLHGCCAQANSTYQKILFHLFGTVKTKKGIMDYILETHGTNAYEVLQDIVKDFDTKTVLFEKK
jgi:hypothetical protein